MAWIYDLLFVIVFAFAAVSSWRKGFLASLAELVGTVVAAGVAIFASSTLAGPVYETFLSGSVSAKVESAVAQSGGDLAAAVQGMEFLPATVREAGSVLPEQITTALQPILLPFVQVLLFVVLCLVLRWIFRLVVGLLCHVNSVPLVGGINLALGLVLGLGVGALDCWVLAMLLWFLASVTLGTVDFLTMGILKQSVGYGIFSAYNPFLTHY